MSLPVDCPSRCSRGFTLVEVLLALAVLGIVTGFVLAGFGGAKEDAFVGALKNDLRNFNLANEKQFQEGSQYLSPDSLQTLDEFAYTPDVSTDSASISDREWFLRVQHDKTDVRCMMGQATRHTRPPHDGLIRCPGFDGNQPPEVDFTASPNPALTGDSIQFNGTSTTDDGAILSYSWDFESAPSKTGQVVYTAYPDDREEEVTLTVTDAYLQEASTTRTITIENRPPTPSFAYSPTVPLSLDSVQFDAGSSRDVDGSITGYSWDFGDGKTGAGETTNHLFETPGSYTVKLTVTDNDSAAATADTTVDVQNRPPSATVAVSDTTPGLGESVSFFGNGSQDPDGSVAEYRWHFGDGGGDTTATATTPHSFSSDGTYPATLVVTDDRGATSSPDTVLLTMNQPPAASLTVSPSEPNAGEEVTLDGSGSGDGDGTIEDYIWTFGDGTTDTTQSATAAHTYSGSSNRTARLTVRDDDGATDSDSVTIRVNGAPTASFVMSPNPAETYEPVTFDASGASDPEGDSLTYRWDLNDDGSTDANGAVASDSFPDDGSYPVRLIASDPGGLADTASQLLTVQNQPPNAAFTASTTDTLTNVSIDFDATASSDPDGTVDTYTWDFGDGSNFTTGETTSHTYLDEGSYEITLTLTDDDNAADSTSATVQIRNRNPSVAISECTPNPADTDQTITCTADASDPDGSNSAITYSWSGDFGGSGSSATEQFPDEGPYEAIVVATDDDGDTDADTATVQVENRSPTASFTMSDSNPVAGESVTFDGSGSDDPDGSITSYVWDFGDGGSTNAAAETTDYTYSSAGEYTVELTVIDDDDDTDRATASINVDDPNDPPVADFTFSPSNPESDTTVYFDASGSSDPNNNIDTYHWDFGDGNTETTTSPTTSHFYGAEGDYSVTLTVTDNGGLQDTHDDTVHMRTATWSCSAVPVNEQNSDPTLRYDLYGTTSNPDDLDVLIDAYDGDNSTTYALNGSSGAEHWEAYQSGTSGYTLANGSGDPMDELHEVGWGYTRIDMPPINDANGDDWWSYTYTVEVRRSGSLMYSGDVEFTCSK